MNRLTRPSFTVGPARGRGAHGAAAPLGNSNYSPQPSSRRRRRGGWPVSFGVRHPLELGRVHCGAVVLLVDVGLEHLWGDVDGVLAAKVLEEVQGLERGDDVLGAEGSHVRKLLDGDGPLVFRQDLKELARPVATVAHEPQVRKRSLGRAELLLALGELVGEPDHKLAVASSLVAGQREDARQVVVLLGNALLGEVANHVRALVVARADHVEEEGLHVVVESLVVQEELREQAQVLAEDALHARVYLVHRHFAVSVDLVARRVEALAPRPHVALQLALPGKVVEVVLAPVERVAVGVLLWEGREVPRVHLVLADGDTRDVLHLCRLLVLLERDGV
mmetsp:Transcript_158/g.437  ORF Transcript_158/g.437 Transcript_158/m.437 type:complete len:335 (+) Transcript_158:66-1070(+)